MDGGSGLIRAGDDQVIDCSGLLRFCMGFVDSGGEYQVIIKFGEGCERGLYRRGQSFPRWLARVCGCWNGERHVADMLD